MPSDPTPLDRLRAAAESDELSGDLIVPLSVAESILSEVTAENVALRASANEGWRTANEFSDKVAIAEAEVSRLTETLSQLRGVAREMHQSFNMPSHPGQACRKSNPVPLATLDRWAAALESPEPPSPPECNGWCTTANDLGASEYGDMIAYAHPDCPLHAWPVAPSEPPSDPEPKP